MLIVTGVVTMIQILLYRNNMQSGTIPQLCLYRGEFRDFPKKIIFIVIFFKSYRDSGAFLVTDNNNGNYGY